MFRGVTSLTMDVKGRLAVPAKHRDALHVQSGGNLVLTAHPHRCLLLYPQPAWEPIAQKIDALPDFDKQASTLKRLLVGYAEDVALDSAGRLLISPALRKWAGLEKQVMLVGQGKKFELWDEDAWHALIDTEVLGDDKSLAAELEGFSL